MHEMGAVQICLLAGAAVIAVTLAAFAVRQWLRIRALERRVAAAEGHDLLTGLLSRRSFEVELELALERARGEEGRLAVIAGDLDGFARVVEALGETGADDVLRQVARDLQKWKRRGDHAARIGSEEFALLLPDTDGRGAFILAERLRRATHRRFGDGPVPLTISFGVAGFPGHATHAGGLMRAADRALMTAKELGRDRSVIYHDDVGRMLAPAEVEGGALEPAAAVALAEALDIRDTGTARHSHRVGLLAELIAVQLEFEPAHVERVRLAGVLHDIGKVGVSNSLLTKQGALSREEWGEMMTHPEIGTRLLSRTEFDDLRPCVAAHHERPDGHGYPAGLSAEEIPREASILAVADAYEAMTAQRSYREAIGAGAARAELEAGAGTQFDPTVVAALLRVLELEDAPGAQPGSAGTGMRLRAGGRARR